VTGLLSMTTAAAPLCTSLTKPEVHNLLSIKCILIDYLITLVSVCVFVCVCPQIVKRLRPQFFTVPIFTIFCMPLRNFVVSKAVVSGTNQK